MAEQESTTQEKTLQKVLDQIQISNELETGHSVKTERIFGEVKKQRSDFGKTHKKREKAEKEADKDRSETHKKLGFMGGLLLAGKKLAEAAAKKAQVAAGKVKDIASAQLAKVKNFSKNILEMLLKGLGLAALWAIFKLIQTQDWEKVLADVGFWIDSIFTAVTRFGAWLGLAKFRAWLKGAGPMVSFMTKIKEMFKAESFFGRIITKIKDFFGGKGGKLSQKLNKITTSIANLFKEEGFFGKILAKIKTFFSGKGGKLSQKFGSITKSIKTLFTGEGKFASIIKGLKKMTIFGKGGSLSKLLSPVLNFFSKIGGLVGKGGGATGLISKIMPKLAMFGKILGKLFLPVTIIMALWDAVSGFMGGFEKTEGNLFQKILGGIGGAVKGLLDFFIFSIAEMIQDVIVWVGEFFGFDMSAVVDFDIVGKIKTSVFKVIDYVVDLFSFKDTSVLGIFGSLIDIVFLPLNMAINFVKNLFGWGDKEKPFSLSGFIFGMLDKVWKWITEELLVNPVEALTGLVSGLLGGYVGFLDWILAMIKKPVVWLLEMFGWDDAAGAVEKFTLKGFLMEQWGKVKFWIKSLLTWASDEKESDSIVVKYAKKAIIAVKDWFGKMFKFDSTSDIIASVINVLTWLPNLVKDGIAAITTWLLKLFGFDEAAEKVANANKFSIGGMVMNVLKSIGDFLKGIFDFDFGAMVASLVESLPSFIKLLIPDRAIKAMQDIVTEDVAGAQTGGPVGKGMPILVGEAGPEMFVPSGSGRILPKAQTETALGRGGGGAPTIVNAPTTNVRGGSSTTMAIASSSINPMHNKYFRTEFSNC